MSEDCLSKRALFCQYLINIIMVICFIFSHIEISLSFADILKFLNKKKIRKLFCLSGKMRTQGGMRTKKKAHLSGSLLYFLNPFINLK